MRTILQASGGKSLGWSMCYYPGTVLLGHMGRKGNLGFMLFSSHGKTDILTTLQLSIKKCCDNMRVFPGKKARKQFRKQIEQINPLYPADLDRTWMAGTGRPTMWAAHFQAEGKQDARRWAVSLLYCFVKYFSFITYLFLNINFFLQLNVSLYSGLCSSSPLSIQDLTVSYLGYLLVLFYF